MESLQKANKNFDLLCPQFRHRLDLAMNACLDSGYHLMMWEGYRSPARQDWLYQASRTRPGPWVTDAQGWQSYHQYGIAADIVGNTKGKPDWSINYDKIIPIFEAHGFENLRPRETCHFQITGGLGWREMRTIAMLDGMPAVWAKVFG